MKKIIFAIALIIGFGQTTTPIFAQKTKVLECQPKKKPKWVNSLVKDYIIVVASSSSLEDAQEKALIKVKEHIISSVADNIASTSEHSLTENIKTGDMSITETYKVVTKTRAADIPFIKGISLNQVEEYYWEKVKESNGTTNYYYHIKYPFSEFQLKKLIMEYERADRQLTEQLNGLIAKIEETNSIEELIQTHTEIKTLSKSFIDVDTRKSQSNVAMSKISQMLKNVSIETINATLGEIRFSLILGDKVMTTTAQPKAKSDCARITNIKANGNEWVVNYTYDECYDDPNNKIVVECRNQFGKSSREYFFNIKADMVDIFVNNDINFTGGDDNGTELTNVECFIPIVSKYDSPFIIEKVVLNIGKESPIIIENINTQYSGKGNHNLKLIINQSINKTNYSAKTTSFLRGTIFYKSVKSGEVLTYKLHNQRFTTSW